MTVLKLFVLLLLQNLISGRVLETSLYRKDSPERDNPVYLNLTVYETNYGNYTLTYDILPVMNTVFDLFKGELMEDLTFQNVARQALVNPAITPVISPVTEAPATRFTLQSLQSAIRTIPNIAVELVGNIFGEVGEMLGVNVTQVRRKPLGSAIQAVSNVAFCNPVFAGFNPGRCNGFLEAKP